METKLIASTGRARGQAVEIRAAKFFIGRHDNCQLRPDLEGLVGIHALLEMREDHYYLRDFGAEGGTGINDRVLHLRETEVFDGDLIQIGAMVLIVSIKTKGADDHPTYRDVPEGWPFLEGEEVHETVAPRVETASKIEVTPAFVEREIATRVEMPARLSDFLAREAAPTAVIDPPRLVPIPAPVPSPTIPLTGHSKPIVARQRTLRAISCRRVGDVSVVTLLSPDLDEEETVSPVRYELRTLIDDGEIPVKTVIDLGQTRFLSSRAVGVLLAHYQALERQGGSMRVCSVSPQIQPVIDQMRLSRLVDIYPTLEEAIETSWD